MLEATPDEDEEGEASGEAFYSRACSNRRFVMTRVAVVCRSH